MTGNKLKNLFLIVFERQKNLNFITKETHELIELLNKIEFEKEYLYNKEWIDNILDCTINKKRLWYLKHRIFNTKAILKENSSADPRSIAQLQYELYKLIDCIAIKRIKHIAPYMPKNLNEINEMMDELYSHTGVLSGRVEDVEQLIEIFDNENAYLNSFSIFHPDHNGNKKMLENIKILNE